MTDNNSEIIHCFVCEMKFNCIENLTEHAKENHVIEYNSFIMSNDKTINILSKVQLHERTEIAKYEAYLKMNNKNITYNEFRKVSLLEQDVIEDLRQNKRYQELVSNFINTELTEADITFLNFDKVVQCKFCTKSFKGIPGLKSHLRLLHNVKQLKSKKGREWNMDEIDKLAELELKYFKIHNKRCLSSHLKDEMSETINELNRIRYYKPYVMRLQKLFVQNDINLSVDDLLKKICEECNTVFEKYNLYESHYREKHGPREDHPTVDLILGIITSDDYEIDSDFINKIFNVSSLDVEQQNVEQLDETTVAKYTCKYCEEVFERKKTYKSHMKHSHPNENELDITVNTNQDKMNETFEFSCKNCSKIFHKESKYIRHMEKCQNSKSINKIIKEINFLTCEYCKEVFERKKTYKSHMKHSHPNESGLDITVNSNQDKIIETIEFSCKNCSKTFHKESKYIRHMEKCQNNKTRNEINVLTCELCEEVFERKKSYKAHMKQSHPNDDCLDTTANSTQDELNDTFGFTCTNCLRCFHKEVTYKRHIEKCHCRDINNNSTVEINGLNCQYCPCQFYKTKSLHQHIEKDHPEKWNEVKTYTEPLFNCEVCAVRFATKEEYNVHQIQYHKSSKRRARDSSDSLPLKRAKH